MSVSEILSYFFTASCLLCAIYVAFSKDLLRVSLAFFLEIASVGGILLGLDADYLAIALFAIALLGSILVIAFSSVITGNLKNSFKSTSGSVQEKVAGALGLFLGLCIGAAVGWAFLTSSFSSTPVVTEGVSEKAGLQAFGEMMLGPQLAVFEILATFVLIIVVSAGLLIRKPNHEN